MIKFVLVCFNLMGVINLYVFSNLIIMDIEEIKNRLSKVFVRFLLNYIVDVEKG